jgi:hypothetical protein
VDGARGSDSARRISMVFKPVVGGYKVGYRDRLDLSRHVNKCVETFSVKMDDLGRIEGLKKWGDHMMVFDLETQFFHIKLAPAAYKYFGFAVPDEQGGE